MHFFVPPWLRHGRPKSVPMSVFSVDVDPTNHRLASAGQDCAVKIWSLKLLASLAIPITSTPNSQLVSDIPPPRALLATLLAHQSAVNCVRWSPTAKRLASGGDDAVVVLYEMGQGEGGGAFGGGGGRNLENWKVKKVLRGHAGDVTDLSWSPDGAMLASASVDNEIRIWNVRMENVVARLSGHTGLVKGVAWDPVGRYLASQSDDRSLRIWRTQDWKVEKVITKVFQGAVVKENSMAFYLRISWSPCGGHLLATNAYKKPGAHHAPMFARDSAFDDQIEFVGHREPVVATRFSPRLYRTHPKKVEKGSKEETYTCMALGSKDCGATIWKAAGQRPFFDMAQMFDSDVIDLSWGTDGYTLVSCSTDGKIMYIRFEPGELGVVVGLEETRKILMDRWRQYGGGGDGTKPLVESVEQLDMEVQRQEKEKTAKDNDTHEKGRKRKRADQHEQVNNARGSPVQIQTSSPPSSPVPIPSTPPSDTTRREQRGKPANRAGQEKGTAKDTSIQPMDVIDDAEVDRIGIVEATVDNQTQQTVHKSLPPNSDRLSQLPEPVRATAAAALENGPTPPADPRIMAAQAETRVRGGKRRITPMAVSSLPSARRPPLPSASPNGFNSSESPFKRPRVELNAKEEEISKDSLGVSQGESARVVSNGPHAPVAALGMPASNGRSVFPSAGTQPLQYAASLSAPSIVGLSMMLLPDRGDGPGRCRVISRKLPRVVVESREQHGNGGGYVVMVTKGGEVQWRDYHSKASPVVALAGLASKFVAVGTGDGLLFLYSANSGRRLVPPIAIDSAPHMLEAFCFTKGSSTEDMSDLPDEERWLVILISRSALCTVFDVKEKKMVCARSAAPLLAKPTEPPNSKEAPPVKAKMTREISFCRVTESGEPILVLSNGHAYVYSTNFCSWLRVADDSAPNSDFVRTVPSTKKVGLLRSLQPGNGLTQNALPSLSGMADLRRSAVESLSHLESLMESAIVLGSACDYRYYLTNYASRVAAAVSDDVENCKARLHELCSKFLNSDNPSEDLTLLGMSCRGLLKDVILPVVSENRLMQRFVAEFKESLSEIEKLSSRN